MLLILRKTTAMMVIIVIHMMVIIKMIIIVPSSFTAFDHDGHNMSVSSCRPYQHHNHPRRETPDLDIGAKKIKMGFWGSRKSYNHNKEPQIVRAIISAPIVHPTL